MKCGSISTTRSSPRFGDEAEYALTAPHPSAPANHGLNVCDWVCVCCATTMPFYFVALFTSHHAWSVCTEWGRPWSLSLSLTMYLSIGMLCYNWNLGMCDLEWIIHRTLQWGIMEFMDWICVNAFFTHKSGREFSGYLPMSTSPTVSTSRKREYGIEWICSWLR